MEQLIQGHNVESTLKHLSQQDEIQQSQLSNLLFEINKIYTHFQNLQIGNVNQIQGKTYLITTNQQTFHKILKFLDMKTIMKTRLVCSKLNLWAITYFPQIEIDLKNRHETVNQEIEKLNLQNQQPIQYPDLEQGLNTINKADIVELKSYKTPPQIIFEVIRLLTFVVQGKACKEPWEEGKKLLSQSNVFIAMLMSFDKDNMTEFQISQLKKISEINGDQVGKVSRVGGVFYQWMDGLRQITETPFYQIRSQINQRKREANQIEKQLKGINKLGKTF